MIVGDTAPIALSNGTFVLRGVAGGTAGADRGQYQFCRRQQHPIEQQGSGGVTLTVNSNLTRVGRGTLDINPSATLTGIALSGAANATRLVINGTLPLLTKTTLRERTREVRGERTAPSRINPPLPW